MGRYSDANLIIENGKVYVNADGDGLDSNGDLFINQGIVLVNGPTNSGNGAIDSNDEFICNGGVLVAVGSSGMAGNPSANSTQCSVSIALDEYKSADELITLCNTENEEIICFSPQKNLITLL